MARITINGISFDPTAPGPATAALARTDATNSDYVLVQTAAPPTEAQLEQLKKLGCVIHEYVSENTFLCTYKPKSLAKVRALKFVAWAGVYMKGFKIPPNLRQQATPAAMAGILPHESTTSTRRTLRKVDIVLHDDVDPNDTELKKKIAAAARINPEDLSMSRHKVRLNVQERYLNDLAAIDQVRNIEEAPNVKLFNSEARPIMNAHVVVNGTTFEREGELVAVADTGFDLGSITNIHPAFTGRVLKLVPFGRPGKTDDPDGHGTHVSGSVLGNGNSSSMGGVIQGTAPKARLIMQSLLDRGGRLGGIPDDLHDLFGPAFNDKARVHTNSWGDVTPGLPYTQSSKEIDDFVFNHPDCVICFAAGNDGIDTNNDGIVDEGQVGSQAAAKNCITVGASENDRPTLLQTYGEFGRAPSRTARCSPIAWRTTPTEWPPSAAAVPPRSDGSSPTSWRPAPASCPPARARRRQATCSAPHRIRRFSSTPEPAWRRRWWQAAAQCCARPWSRTAWHNRARR